MNDFLLVIPAFEESARLPQYLEALGAELSDSELAIVIIYEDRGLAGFATQVQAQGGRELWTGGVDISELDTLVTESEQEN